MMIMDIEVIEIRAPQREDLHVVDDLLYVYIIKSRVKERTLNQSILSLTKPEAAFVVLNDVGAVVCLKHQRGLLDPRAPSSQQKNNG